MNYKRILDIMIFTIIVFLIILAGVWCGCLSKESITSPPGVAFSDTKHVREFSKSDGSVIRDFRARV